MKNKQNNATKVYVNLEYHPLLRTRHPDPWCNMLQTLEINENIDDKKLSVEQTLTKEFLAPKT